MADPFYLVVQLIRFFFLVFRRGTYRVRRGFEVLPPQIHSPTATDGQHNGEKN